jgi:hypothetical protein
MRNNLLTLLATLLLALPALACPLCAKNQPKGFANITHGVGPGGPFDYVMLYGSIAVVVLTMGLFLRFLVRPDGRRNQARREHLSFT